MSSWLAFLLILFGTAGIAWALTEGLKKTLENRFKFVKKLTDVEAKKRLWWTPMLVVVAIAIGVAIGYPVGEAAGWTGSEGALTGALGGALATFLVSVFKGNLVDFIKMMIDKQ